MNTNQAIHGENIDLIKNHNHYTVPREKRFCPFCSFGLNRIFIEGRDRLFCLRCQTPIYENPLPAACVVLIDKKNKILLVKRKIDPQKGLWCLPGGFIELAETPKEAAKRELKEETGIIGLIDSIIGVSSSSNKMKPHSVVVIGYLVKHFSGKASPGDDASEARFFNLSQLPKIAFKSHKDFIKTAYSFK